MHTLPGQNWGGFRTPWGGLPDRRPDAVQPVHTLLPSRGPSQSPLALATCLRLPDDWGFFFSLFSCINRLKNNTPTPAPVRFKPQPAAGRGK